jgi:hypothetical protein
VIEERSDDESVITENPVENGSVTNDHAYDLPQQLELTYAWAGGSPQANGSTSFLNTMYAQFLTLKQAKVLLFVMTGKRPYANMLIKGLAVTTDKDTENVLVIRVSLQQLLLTSTTVIPTVQVPTSDATSNIGSLSLQPAPNYNFTG